MDPITLDTTDRALLASLKERIPLDHRPFQRLGEKLDISEQECLERLGRLKSDGVIRELKALFDINTLGYKSAVVAIEIDKDKIQSAVKIIYQHPGVSSVYSCDNKLNLWFAIALPPTDSVDSIVDILKTQVGAERKIILSVQRNFSEDQTQEILGLEMEIANLGKSSQSDKTKGKLPFNSRDLKLIKVMQEDLPLIEIPYGVWAEQAQVTEEQLFEWAEKMEGKGILRQVSAILNPQYKTGAKIETLVAWNMSASQVDAASSQLVKIRDVSGCFLLSISAEWQYPLLTTILSHNTSVLKSTLDRIEVIVGSPEYEVFAVKQLSPSRHVKYFSSELDAWWKEVGGGVTIPE